VTGPIVHTTRDAATILGVMASAGYDPAENKTIYGQAYRETNYTKYLTGTALQRKPRIGVLDVAFSNATDADTQAVNAAMKDALDKIQAAGAEIIHIPNPVFNMTAISAAYDVQK